MYTPIGIIGYTHKTTDKKNAISETIEQLWEAILKGEQRISWEVMFKKSLMNAPLNHEANELDK